MDCGQCGAGNRDEARFCDQCGAPMAAAPPATPEVPISPPTAEVPAPAARMVVLDRLDELGVPVPEDSRVPNVANLASHVHATIIAAIGANDVEVQRALTTRDFTQDDRRAVVAVPPQDRRGMARYHEIMLEQGYEILPPEPLAVRGDRLTLARVTHRTAAGDESILLAIIELDADGLIARATSFDDADLAAALADLDQRYAVGEGAPHGKPGVAH